MQGGATSPRQEDGLEESALRLSMESPAALDCRNTQGPFSAAGAEL